MDVQSVVVLLALGFSYIAYPNPSAFFWTRSLVGGSALRGIHVMTPMMGRSKQPPPVIALIVAVGIVQPVVDIVLPSTPRR